VLLLFMLLTLFSAPIAATAAVSAPASRGAIVLGVKYRHKTMPIEFTGIGECHNYPQADLAEQHAQILERSIEATHKRKSKTCFIVEYGSPSNDVTLPHSPAGKAINTLLQGLKEKPPYRIFCGDYRKASLVHHLSHLFRKVEQSNEYLSMAQLPQQERETFLLQQAESLLDFWGSPNALATLDTDNAATLAKFNDDQNHFYYIACQKLITELAQLKLAKLNSVETVFEFLKTHMKDTKLRDDFLGYKRIVRLLGDLSLMKAFEAALARGHRQIILLYGASHIDFFCKTLSLSSEYERTECVGTKNLHNLTKTNELTPVTTQELEKLLGLPATGHTTPPTAAGTPIPTAEVDKENTLPTPTADNVDQKSQK
jgi:hypothetical protein